MTDQQPVWFAKPKSIPADVQYAHNLGRGRLLTEQIMELVKPIHPGYVSKKNSNSYLAHHQARAEMNRIFGYGNWDVAISNETLIYEEAEPSAKSKSGFYYRACYRGKSLVTIKDLWGMPVASYEGVHAEANSNLPDRGEAHAMALTSLESYALRRALINLGDRFGLGLYNGGSVQAHGIYTIQLQNGLLFDWTDANVEPMELKNATGSTVVAIQQGAAPFTQPTHETVKATTVGDTEVYTEDDASNYTSGGDNTPDVPTKAPRKTAAQKRQENFAEAREQVQAGNQQARDAQHQPPQQGGYPEPVDPAVMQSRLQAGFKVDGAGGSANA